MNSIGLVKVCEVQSNHDIIKIIYISFEHFFELNIKRYVFE